MTPPLVKPLIDSATQASGESMAEGPGALLTAAQTRWVRRAVIVMSTVLIIGIAVVIGRIIYLVRPTGMQATSGQAANALGTSASFIAQPTLQGKIKLALPADAGIKSITAAGSRLAILHSLPGGGDGIVVLDLATGQVVSRVEVVHEK